jgi:hypothetical protein
MQLFEGRHDPNFFPLLHFTAMIQGRMLKVHCLIRRGSRVLNLSFLMTKTDRQLTSSCFTRVLSHTNA